MKIKVLATKNGLDVKAALKELREKTLEDVQRETAYKWASRAVAAYILGKDHDAEEYRHEALEHAALVEDDCATLIHITREIEKVRP